MARAAEISLDSSFEREEPELVESSSGLPQYPFVRKVCERRPSPQAKRLEKKNRCALRTPPFAELRTVGHEPLEAMEIECLVIEPQQIPGLAGLDGVTPEILAEPRDVTLEDVCCGVGWLFGPDLVDEPRGRDDLTGVEQKHGQHGTRARAAELDRRSVNKRLEWAENAKFRPHRATVTSAASPEQPARPPEWPCLLVGLQCLDVRDELVQLI